MKGIILGKFRSCTPGVDLKLQGWIWSFRGGSGAAGMDLELQGWIWSSRGGSGAPGVDLELQGWI